MKRFFSGCILFFIILSQFQVLGVYANTQETLNTEKQKAEATLDAVEQVIDQAVEKIDKKLNDSSKEAKLAEKQEEIVEYLEKVSEQIQEETSTKDIKKKIEEAKKTVVLKVVSGVTDYESAEENISSDVADTPVKIEQALDAIQDSLQTKSGDYSIIVQTKKSVSQVKTIFRTFDTKTKVSFMYEIEGEKYLEVTVQEDSLFRKEMMEDIKAGILPESFLGIQIIIPEVFGIGETVELSGENISQTWGIEKYQTYQYFSDIEQISKSIKVGVVDTGIDYNHPDLQQNVNQTLGKDFVNDDDDAWDDQGHGTHVAGTIAANINGAGIIGVNPYVDLVPLKICTAQGFCPSYAVLRSLEYAKDNNIDILNMSLGGSANPQGHAICAGIQSYTQNGGIVVAASGNSNVDTSTFVPGGCESAITVGAIDSSSSRASFSNYGDKVDVSAPGVGVYSTYPLNKGPYKQLSGTSMATPHIVGLVSLMQAYKSNITTSEIKSLLKQYPQIVQSPDGKNIASGVDIEGLIDSFYITEEGVEEVLEEETVEIIEEVTEENKQENILEGDTREGLIVTEGTLGDTSYEEIITPEIIHDDIPVLGEIELEDIQIDFGDENSQIEINEIGEIQESILEENVIHQDYYTAQGNKIFDEQGNTIDEETQINTENIPVDREIIKVGPDFDIYNLPDLPYSQNTGENTSEEVQVNSIEEEPEIRKIFINGATESIEVNSIIEESEKIYSLPGLGESGIRIGSTGSGETQEIGIQSVQDGLVGSWDLNGDANDSSGNENHGTVNNVTWEQSEGSNEMGNFSDNGNIQISIGEYSAYTFSFMLETTNTNWGEAASLIMKGNRGSYGDYNSIGVIMHTNGHIGGRNRLENGAPPITALTVTQDNSYPLNDGKQYHVLVEMETNGVYNIYVNNILYISGTCGGISAKGASYINDSTDPWWKSIPAKISLVKIYNKILTNSQRGILYQEGQEKLLPVENTESSSIDGLVGSWDLNGNANDSSGNENHGTASNVIWEQSEGSNQVGYFNGSNSRVNINEGIYSNFSIRTKIKVNSFPTSGLGGLMGNTGWTAGYLHFNSKAGGVIEIIQNGDNSTTEVNLETGKWYDLVYTRVQGSSQKVYLDGKLVTEKSSGLINNPTNFHNFNLGNTYNNNRWFDGSMSGFEIYNKVLTQAEIDQLYQEGQAKLFPVENTESSSINGLIGSWDLNGNANDSSGNENHGTVNNVTWEQSEGSNEMGDFNGSSQITLASGINISSSYSYWIKANSNKMLMGQSNTNGYMMYHENVDGKLGIFHWMGSAQQEILTSHDYNDENIHVVFNKTSFVGGTVYWNVYINGIYQGISSVALNRGDKWNVLGKTSDGHYFDGEGGMLKVYDKTLSETEIDQLYQEGKEKLFPVENTESIKDLEKNKVLEISKSQKNGLYIDETGNGNNGTPTNVTDSTVGSSNIMQVSSGGNIDYGNIFDINGTEAWSFSMIFDVDITDNFCGLINKQMSTSPFTGYALSYERITGRIRFDIEQSSGGNHLWGATDNNVIQQSNKYHLVWTYDGSKDISGVNIYIDGVDQNIITGKNTLTGSPSNAISFKNNQTGANGVNISDFIRYDKVLTQAEIDQLYQEGQAKLFPVEDTESSSIDGLVGSWDLNGDANDSSGNENHGTVNNVTWEQSEGSNEIGKFNGSNTSIEIAHDDIQNLINSRTPFSISFQINPNSAINGQNIMDGRGSDWNGLYIETSVSNILSFNRSNGVVSDNIGSIPIIAGENHSIVLTYDGTTAKAYLNKNLQNSKTSTRNINSNGTLYIGKAGPFNGGFTNAKIGLLKIYNKVLIQTEIDQLYQEGQAKLFPVENGEEGIDGEVFITSIATLTDTIDLSNQNNVELNISSIYSGNQVEAIQYSYSFDGESFTDIPGNIEISSQDEGSMISVSLENNENYIDYLDNISQGEQQEVFEYIDNGEISTYINENIEGLNIQDESTIFQDDMSDGVLDSFYSVNSNNRTIESNGYIQTTQVVTDQQSSLHSDWFDIGENGTTIEYDFYSHPNGDYFYGGITLISLLGEIEEPFYSTQHLYTRWYDGGYKSLKNTIETSIRKPQSSWSTAISIPGLHNQWVHHKIEVNVKENKVIHIINGQVYEIETDLSDLKNTKIKLITSPFGWWPGHFVRTDNLFIKSISSNVVGEEIQKQLYIDASQEEDGYLKVYIQAKIGDTLSNTAFKNLTKEVIPLNKATNFEVETSIGAPTVQYTWQDNTDAEIQYLLRDENSNIVIDNIPVDSENFEELNLIPNIQYTRKLCAKSVIKEVCTEDIIFTIPIPEVITQELIFPGAYINTEIFFPTNIDNYTMHGEGDWIFYWLTKTRNRLYVYVDKIGEYTITLRDENGFDRYVIHMISEPSYRDYTLNLTDTFEVWYHYNYNYQEQDSSIVDYYETSNDGYLHAKKLGETEVHIYKDGGSSLGLKQIWRIKVVPIPEPTIIECEITIGERCRFYNMERSGEYLEQSKPGMLDIDLGNHMIDIDGEASGSAKLYIRSRTGNYISRIINITVHPKPTAVRTCEAMVGIDCSTGWYIRDNDYSFAVSQPGIVQLSVLDHYNLNGSFSGKQKLHIKGLIPGEVEVYVYEKGDHTATIQTTVIPESPVTFSENPAIAEQGWEKIVQTTGGYAPYYPVSYNEERIDFSIDKYTGEIEIDGKVIGSTYAVVKDKYNQQAILHIQIEDTKLLLENSEIDLLPGETGYVNVTQYNGGLHSLFRKNNNLKTYQESWLEDGERKYRIRIEALYTGRTVLSVEDFEQPNNNWATIAVTIGGDTPNPDYKEFRHPDAIDPCVGEDLSGSLHDGICTDDGEEVVEGELDEEGAETEDLATDQGLESFLEKILGTQIQSISSGETIEVENVTWLDRLRNEQAFNILREHYEEKYPQKTSTEVEMVLDNLNTYIYGRIHTLNGNQASRIYWKAHDLKKQYQGDEIKESLLQIIQYNLILVIENYFNNKPINLNAFRHINKYSEGGLTSVQEQEYIDGLQDTLTQNGMYEAAGSLAIGMGLGILSKSIIDALGKKYGEKVAAKLAFKVIPHIGWAFLAIGIATAGEENLEYYSYCTADLSDTYEGKGPMYYCGKMTVNALMIAGGVLVSKVNRIGIFKKVSFIKNIKYDNVKLQKKYDAHAKDFGLLENFNISNREKFKNILNSHIGLEGTIMKKGTHRTTQKVQHFYNSNTKLNVMYDLDGNFVSGWKLGQSQIDNLFRNGNVQ